MSARHAWMSAGWDDELGLMQFCLACDWMTDEDFREHLPKPVIE